MKKNRLSLTTYSFELKDAFAGKKSCFNYSFALKKLS